MLPRHRHRRHQHRGRRPDEAPGRPEVPDLLAVASFYKDWGAIGGGLTNYMAYGALPVNGYGDPAKFKFPRVHVFIDCHYNELVY